MNAHPPITAVPIAPVKGALMIERRPVDPRMPHNLVLYLVGGTKGCRRELFALGYCDEAGTLVEAFAEPMDFAMNADAMFWSDVWSVASNIRHELGDIRRVA